MNLHEWPMVVFTVFSQLAVGVFVVLGVLRLRLVGNHDARTVERVIAPALYATGPTLLVGLAVSMLHMNDIGHTLNVLRHWDSSWLSREIILGSAFAVVGAVFGLMEWLRLGAAWLRQALAVLTAVLGIGLVWAQASIYTSLTAVPAWHTWVVPAQFFATTALLGVLAVAASFMIVAVVRARAETSTHPVGYTGKNAPVDPAKGAGAITVLVRSRIREINAPNSEAEWALTVRWLKRLALVGAVVALVILVLAPVQIAQLAGGDAAAQASAEILTGPTMWVRLGLTAGVVVVLGFFVHRMAGTTALERPRALVAFVLLAFGMAVAGEMLGRALHYAAMVRVGI